MSGQTNVYFSRKARTTTVTGTGLTWKLIGGGGFFGSILTTLDSTLGGGRKLFFPTYILQNKEKQCPQVRVSCWTNTLITHKWMTTLPKITVLICRGTMRLTGQTLNSHLHKMIHSWEQLCVYGEPAVQLIAWLGHQPHCKFPLEHQDCTPALSI